MKGWKLLNKTILGFTEPNAAMDTLNSLTSNELDKPQNAFLDKIGRVVAVFDQYKQGNIVFAVVENRYAAALLTHLAPYLKISHLRVKILPAEAYLIAGSQPPATGLSELASFENVLQVRFHQPFGYLTLCSPHVKPSETTQLEQLSDEEYTILRLEYNIPLQGIDYHNEPISNLNLPVFSLTKGCYLGQEVVARVYNRSRPPRQLTRILYDELPNEVTRNGKSIGKITSAGYSSQHKKWIIFAIVQAPELPFDEGMCLTQE